MENEEKTVDVVVQEYEQQIAELKQEHEKELLKIKEEHKQEIRSIISGRKNPSETSKKVGNEEDDEEEKGFFETELDKTRKNLKLK